jgi:hypothetical protein
MTVDLNLVVDPSHLEALTQAALRSQLTLRGYIAEIIEAHAAGLLLPTVVPSGGRAGGAVREESAEAEGNFPWPADVYRLHSPRSDS